MYRIISKKFFIPKNDVTKILGIPSKGIPQKHGMMAKSDVEEKVLRYERFLNETLRGDLQYVACCLYHHLDL